MKSAPHIAFDYRPSLILLLVCAGFAVLAETAIFLSGLSWSAKIVLAVMSMGYAAVAMRNYYRPRFSRIIWYSAGHWRLIHAHAHDHEIEAILTSTARLGPILVLSWIPFEASRFSAVLLPDNSNAEARRRLRVRLGRTAPIVKS